MPAWAVFLLSALAVILAGARLSRDGDAIAEGTGLGGAWIGAVLVAGATSLPELATDIYAVRAGQHALAIGDLFGSCMANILILAVADLMVKQVRVLTRVAINQVLIGLLAISLLVTAALGGIAHLNFTVLGIGWGPLLAGIGYLVGMRLLHVNRQAPVFESVAEAAEHEARAPDLRRAIIGFVLSSLVILGAARFLAESAGEIAVQLGVSGGFIGMVLVALTTSLPELTVSVAAVRSGSYDLAVGNLLGSNCFNMAILLVLDVVDGPAPLLAKMEPGLLVGALFATLLTAHSLLGVLNKSERRVWFLEPDAVFLVLMYFLGMYMTYRIGH
ncbi:MAG: cation antiporter (Na+/Ca2+) [Armatimonadetes bacterium]|jgi:cation:H+ antiporter|nr:cation antiporter (Na+/Ca2+) [Armatimonadota bacterium]